MEIAEHLVPFGEYADTLRVMYLAAAGAASQGSKEAGARAAEIIQLLLGKS